MSITPHTGASKPPASMVMTRIGGEDYPLKSVPQCRTCQSPHRLQIENMLITGRSYRAIASSLVGLPTGHFDHPTADSISEHFKAGHMPLPAAAQRRLIERRAIEIGKNIEAEVDDLTDYVTVNQMIVQKGFERLQRGEIAPDVGETIAAIRSLHAIEQSIEGGADSQAWMTALMVYMEESRKIMPPEMWEEFAKRLTTNPVLKAMAAQANTIDGEVVDDPHGKIS